MDVDEPAVDDVDLANAVNLSESEDEVEEERIAGDFFTTSNPDFVRACLPPSFGLFTGFLHLRTLTQDRTRSTSFNSLQISPRSHRRQLWLLNHLFPLWIRERGKQ